MKKSIVLLTLCILTLNAYSDSFYYKNGSKVVLEPYNQYMPPNDKIDYYKDQAGILVGVSNKIILGLKYNTDISTLLYKYNLLIYKQLDNKTYVITTNDKSKTLQLANKLSTEADVEFAQPDFIKQRLTR